MAVAAWTPHLGLPGRWVSVVAVQTGHANKGFGLRAKQEVKRRAIEAGASELVSFVHIDNEPMLKINKKLGAKSRRDPSDPYRLHMECVITLGERPCSG